MRGSICQRVAPFGTLLALADELTYFAHAFRQMDPENKPTRDELKEEVLKVAKGLAGLGGFNLVSVERRCDASKKAPCGSIGLPFIWYNSHGIYSGLTRVMAVANALQNPRCTVLSAVV